MSQELPDKEFFSAAEAAEHLGKSQRWVNTLCQQRRMGQKVGSYWMITKRDLANLVILPHAAPKRKKPSRQQKQVTEKIKAFREQQAGT
jgi:hypothetical protein